VQQRQIQAFALAIRASIRRPIAARRAGFARR
jgi:hypothetical protein